MPALPDPTRAQSQAAAPEEEPTTQTTRSRYPPNAAYISADGKVTYDAAGRRLDSLGNVARGGMGGGGLPVPMAPVAAGPPVSQVTGEPLRLPETQFLTEYGIPTFQGAYPSFVSPGYATATYPDLSDAELQRLLAYISSVYLPVSSQFFNQASNVRDFEETVRRFDLEFPQRQREAAFAAAGRGQFPLVRYLSY